MPVERSNRSWSVRGWGVGLTVAIVALLIAFAVGAFDRGLFQPGGLGPSTAHDDPVALAESTATPSPGAPPVPAATLITAPEPPYSVTDSASLTLPQEVRIAHGTFFLSEGTDYLVQFDLATLKPENAPGIGMYLGVTFSCSPAGGGPGGVIGGTENLLPGVPVTYTNQFLLTPQRSGEYTCSLLANAPYDDVAAAGTTIELEASWGVAPVTARARETPSAQRLPLTVADGSREVAFSQMLTSSGFVGDQLRILTSLHLTTCTGANGSREDGRTWCGAKDIDESGNTFIAETRVDVIGSDGAVCGTLDVEKQEVEIDKWRHHQLLHLDRKVTVPSDLCGSRLRVSVVIDNQGPASIVVHEQNSSLVTV